MYIYIYIYIYIYYIFLYKKYYQHANCLSIDDPFLLNKKDSQGVLSNI